MDFGDDIFDGVHVPLQHQITDQEPDLERRRASVHRGSSYGEEQTYAPHGTSSAPSYVEGDGSMRKSDEVTALREARYAEYDDVFGATVEVRRQMKAVPFEQEALATADDLDALYAEGTDVLGAGSARRTVPTGTKRAAKGAAKGAASAVRRLKKSGEKAVKSAKKSAGVAVQLNAKAKMTAAKSPPTKVKGDVLGITAPRTVPPKSALANAAKAKIAAGKAFKAEDAAKKAAAKAKKVEASIRDSLRRIKAMKVRTMTGKTKTLVKGLDDVLGVDDLDAEIDAALGPDTSAPSSWDYSKAWVGPVPSDAVVYDGSKEYPTNCWGSYNVFYGTDRNSDGWGKGFLYGNIGKGPQWVQRFGTNFADVKRISPILVNNLPAIQLTSMGNGGGPLIGSPGKDVLPRGSVAANTAAPGWTKGLIYCADEDKWFWLPGTAPKWATQEIDLEVARLTRETEEANAVAAEAEQAALEAEQAAQLKAEQEEQARVAKEDAEAARQQQIEDVRIARETAQYEEQQRRAQADADRQAAQAQTEFDRQAAQAEREEARAQAEYERQAALAQVEADRQARLEEMKLMQQQVQVQQALAERQPAAPQGGYGPAYGPVADPYGGAPAYQEEYVPADPADAEFEQAWAQAEDSSAEF